MKEEEKQGYYAGIVGIFIGIILIIITINIGLNDLSGQVFGAISVIFLVLGIGSMIKPEFIGVLFAELLNNIGKNTQDDNGGRKQVQTNPNKSSQGYTEKGDVHIEHHYYKDKDDKEE